MMPPWSYSHLSAFENCPRKYHHYYVLKDVPFEESPEMTAGKDKHKELETRVDAGELIDPQYNAHTEVKLGIDDAGRAVGFFGAGVWGRGVVDVLIAPQNSSIAVIFDWKTGKVREDSDELGIHAVLVHAVYPLLTKIYGQYVWLRENRMGRLHDLSSTKTKFEQLQDRAAAIEHQLKMGYMPPKQTPLCQWCKVKTCEFNPNR